MGKIKNKGKLIERTLSLILSFGMVISLILPVTAENEEIIAPADAVEVVEDSTTEPEVVITPETPEPVEPTPTIEVVVEPTIDPTPTIEVVADPTVEPTPTTTPEVVEDDNENIQSEKAVMTMQSLNTDEVETFHNNKGCSIVFVVQDKLTNLTGENNFQELNCGWKFDFEKKSIPQINDKGRFEVKHYLVDSDTKQYSYDELVSFLTATNVNSDIVITVVVRDTNAPKATINFVSSDINLGTLTGTTSCSNETELAIANLDIPTPLPTGDNKFSYWTVNGSNYATNSELKNAGITVEPGSSLTVTAVFEEKLSAKVLFTTDGNGYVDGKNSVEFSRIPLYGPTLRMSAVLGDAPNPVATPINDNYEFVGWRFIDENNAPLVQNDKLDDYLDFFLVAAGKTATVRAEFQLKETKSFKINYATQGNGTLDPSDAFSIDANFDANFDLTTLVIPTPNASENNEFAHWTVEDQTFTTVEELKAYLTTFVTSTTNIEKTVTAVFKEKLSAKVLFTTDGNGYVNGQPSVEFSRIPLYGPSLKMSVILGDAPNPVATPINDNYEFVGWRFIDENNAPLIQNDKLDDYLDFFLVAAGKTASVRAEFQLKETKIFTINYATQGNGTLDPSDAFSIDANYDVNFDLTTLVIPTPNASEDNKFAHWTVDGQTFTTAEELKTYLTTFVTSTTSIEKTVTAVFEAKEKKTINIDFLVEGNGTLNAGQLNFNFSQTVNNDEVYDLSTLVIPTVKENNPSGKESYYFKHWRVDGNTYNDATELSAYLGTLVNSDTSVNKEAVAVFDTLLDTTITFEAGENGVLNGVETLIGRTVALPVGESRALMTLLDSIPTATSNSEVYDFIGWKVPNQDILLNDSELVTYLNENNIEAGESVTITALFENNQLVTTVRFISNGERGLINGSTAVNFTNDVRRETETSLVSILKESGIPSTTNQTGYTFAGWRIEGNGTTMNSGELNTYLANNTIKAGNTITIEAIFDTVVAPVIIPEVEALIPPVIFVPVVPVAPAPEVIPDEVTPEVVPAPTPEVIEEEVTPLANKQGTWALLNLILMFGTVVLGGMHILKKKEEENEEERIERSGKLLAALTTLGSILIFILTQDLRNRMVMIDSWTVAMLAVALVQCAIFFLTKKKETIVPEQH